MWLTSDLAEKVDAPKSFFPVGVSERELLLCLLEEHYNRPSSIVYSYDGLDGHVCSFGNNYGFMISHFCFFPFQIFHTHINCLEHAKECEMS